MSTFLEKTKHQKDYALGCTITDAKMHASYLENDGFDQRIHRGHEKVTEAGVLETPQHDAAFAENGKKVQHFTIRLKKNTTHKLKTTFHHRQDLNYKKIIQTRM